MSDRPGWLRRSFQVIVLDGASGAPARRFNITPRAVLGWGLLFGIACMIAGWLLATPWHDRASGIQSAQWQRQLQESRNQAAEARATLKIRNARIQALEEELARSERHARELASRIRIYESILEARKSAGVRILRAKAHWTPPNLIAWDIVLVKGGNYPRRVAGSLKLIGMDDGGHQALLRVADDETLPYRMETHTFLRGSAPWLETWRPTRLRIIRLNHRGEARDQLDIVIEEEHA